MNDPENYAAPSRFNGFRFIRGDINSRRLTDVDLKFPLWGLGRRVWCVSYLFQATLFC